MAVSDHHYLPQTDSYISSLSRPIENSQFYPHTLDFYSLNVVFFFLPLPKLSLYMGCFPFRPGNCPTALKIQIKQNLNVKPSLSPADSPSPWGPRTLYSHFGYHPVLLCIYMPMSCSKAEAVSDSYLHPSCLTPCSMNVWWMTKWKNVHYWKIAQQSSVRQYGQEMFSSNVVPKYQYLTLSWFILKHRKLRRACSSWKKDTFFS